MAKWSSDARADLLAIWNHQELWNGADRADAVYLWLLDFADSVAPRQWQAAPVAGAHMVTKDGYVLLVRETSSGAEVIGAFGPGMNWTMHAKDR